MPTLTFTNGNDSYDVNAAGSYDLTFLAGDDTLTTRHASATTVATMGDGNDFVFHRGGTADVDGDAGADRFEVYASGLTADGGADADLFNIRGGTGLNLTGGLGVDRFNFYAASTSILIHGGDGSDDFFGYNQTISGDIYGDAGNDYFVGFRGSAANLRGGTGNDIYRADATNEADFIESAGQGTDSVQVARGDNYTLPANIERISVQGFSGSTVAAASLFGNELNNTITAHNNVETLFGLDGDDRLFGKGADDIVYGGNGNDYLDGGPDNDTLNGEAGNDTINGRAGDDTMAGGAGNDTYYVDALTDSVLEGVSAGTDIARVSIDFYILPDNVENGYVFGPSGIYLSGNDLGNLLVGGPGLDRLHGEDGNDIIYGGLAGDGLHGENGDDTLYGGDGNDSLYGDESVGGTDGSDVLVGGLGQDYFETGEGSDIIFYQQTFDALFNEFGNADEIADFDVILDNIDLSSIDADITQDGHQTFHFTGDTPDGTVGNVWLESIDGFEFYLFAEVSGDELADMAILLDLPGGADSFTEENLIL